MEDAFGECYWKGFLAFVLTACPFLLHAQDSLPKNQFKGDI